MMFCGQVQHAQKEFIQRNGKIKKFGNITWFTNLDIKKRHEDFVFIKRYKGCEDEYPKYDNYDAIEVSKVKDIPEDYDGVMGVPITFLDNYNPEQFVVIGISGNLANPLMIDGKRKSGRFYVNGKRLYDRIVIRNKHPEKPKV